MRNLLNSYRQQLTNYESVLAYSLLGIVGGLASGLAVLGFELAIGELARVWGVGDGGENFEALPQWALFALPAGGATILGILYSLLKPEDRETGIVHVISRMHSHYGALPLRNALVQFVGGTFALATGQSGGPGGTRCTPGWRCEQPAGPVAEIAQQQPAHIDRLRHCR